MLSKILVVFLFVAAVRSEAARLKSLFHLDLDDCDDVAADADSLYFACHSAHAPGKAPAIPPNMDAWVARLDRRTGKLLYLTQLGGKGVDVADRVKVDNRGHAYVTGFTGSRDFPITANAVQRVYGGGESDAFLAEMDPAGRILYSSYIGGSQADQGNGIALAPNGDLWIAGTTWSSDFPNVKQRFGSRGKGDLFVVRLKPEDAAVHSAMLLGGSSPEKLTGIAIGGSSVFVTGYTESADFPVLRPLQARLGGSSDAFLVALRYGLDSIMFSTYLGGSGDDSAWGVALDPQGNPVVAGITESDDLPVTGGAFQTRRGGQADAFLMKLDKSGQKVLLATYYGGSGLDHAGYDGGNIAVAGTGTIWMAGLTNSRDLIVPGGYRPQYGGGEQDGFLIALSPSGRLCYGTYTGSTARALLEGVAFADSETVLYAVGTVIRPIQKNSPTPNPKERYGMFVVGLETPRDCH
ncbi:MAG TPA: SBBP repeat-containing protein [Candidatus Acidoferrales bacterium]|nr:SBBP repeat-containing protein [Candidatus Acidoferrales bacterium]